MVSCNHDAAFKFMKDDSRCGMRGNQNRQQSKLHLWQHTFSRVYAINSIPNIYRN